MSANWQERIWIQQQRAAAATTLSLAKMAMLVPFRVKCTAREYEATVVSVVFDPSRVEEVNKTYNSAGYIIRRGLAVIAATDDEAILVWQFDLSNSVHVLKKWEEVGRGTVAFLHIQDIFDCLGIVNRKVELNAILSDLRVRTKTHGTFGIRPICAA